ncbi:MAG: methyltransferase domain-containing protein [candidate division WOR-3 bacterium]
MKEENSVTKSWFKDWSDEYDNTLGKVDRHDKLLDLVVDSSRIRDGQKVLDIGCGTGLLSLKFLEKADCIIYGIDNSSEMFEIFKEKIKKLNLADKISLGLEDAENIDFRDEEFDIIASTVTLHHVKEKYPVIKKIYKLLKPGGRLLIGDIDVDTTGDLEDPERLLRILNFLKDEFVLALKGGGLKAFSRMYDNGKKHILNDGEYCVSFKQWKEFCEKAGFKEITIKTLTGFQWFKVLVGVR